MMSLRTKIRDYWHSLQRGEPGRRFQERYERARAHDRDHIVWRVLKILGGIAAVIIGLVEMIFPGPAVVFLFIGGALLATQSRVVARCMDWTEVRVRKLWRLIRRKWHAASTGSRATLMSLAMGAGATSGYMVYRVIAQ